MSAMVGLTLPPKTVGEARRVLRCNGEMEGGLMVRKRSTGEQIIGVLKEAGAKTLDLCCKHGMS